jgi:hypothetical protein
MPLLDARGAAAEELAIVSGVATDATFWSAVEELVTCSLLNAGYAGGRLLYSIHRLTENFILSDLVHDEQTYPPIPLPLRQAQGRLCEGRGSRGG